MPIVLLAALAITQVSAADVAARFAIYCRSCKGLAVKMRVTADGFPGTGDAKLVFEGRTEMRLDVGWGPIDYTMALSPTAAIEIERSHKQYNEFEPTPKLSIPPSRLVGILRASLPLALLNGSIYNPQSKSSKISGAGRETLGGQSVDHVRIVDDVGRGASETVDAFIDAEGRMRKYEVQLKLQNGSFHGVIELSDYVVNPPAPAGLFNPSPPTGFVPFALPSLGQPPTPGSNLRPGSWTSVATGKEVSLDKILGSKKTLLIVLDSTSGPSARFRAALSAINSTAQAGGASVAIATVDRDTASARALGAQYYDETGRSTVELEVPGTPYMFLLGPKSKVVQSWYGFDPADKKGLLESLRTALGE